jgi:hypothetical protein
VAHRYPVVKPHAWKLVDRHRPGSPGEVGNQNAIPRPSPKILLDYNDQTKANELSASHIAAQSPRDNSAATTNMARAFVDRNAKQADR